MMEFPATCQDRFSTVTALAVVASSSFLTAFSASAVNLAIPRIGTEFGCTAFLLGWVVSSYVLGSAVFLLPFGRLADITGRKRLFVTGLILFALSSLLCALAPSIGLLIAFRAMQGISSSMIFSTAMAILTSVYPSHRRGQAVGISVSMTYIGLSLGPAVGGFMSQQFGWRSIFYLNVAAGALIAACAALRLRGEWKGSEGERYDLIGAALYASGMVLLLFGLSSVANSVAARYIVGAGLLLMIVFYRHEITEEYPLVRLELYTRNVAFLFSNLAAMINYSATHALSFLLSLYLQWVAGYDPVAAGIILLAQPCVMALLSPVSGSLSDRIEPRLLASWGMGVTTVGLFLFSFITARTTWPVIIANLGVIGLGFALFSSPNTSAIMGLVDKQYYGIASSSVATMRVTGQAISMAIVTLIMTANLGNTKIGPEHAGLLIKVLRQTFLVFTLICLGGIFASLARGNINSARLKTTEGGKPAS